MSPTPKKFKRANNTPLPKPNVEFATAADADDMTPEKVHGMVCNPIYTGIGPFETIIEESEWIQSALTMIASEGAEQFLVNMLYVLRKSLGSDTSASRNESE